MEQGKGYNNSQEGFVTFMTTSYISQYSYCQLTKYCIFKQCFFSISPVSWKIIWVNPKRGFSVTAPLRKL
jgi:hypothetical protein